MLQPRIGTNYPSTFQDLCADHEKRALGAPFGLTNFGVHLVILMPGLGSTDRHRHTNQDKLICVAEGELTMITEAGKQFLKSDMTAGFPAGIANGHKLLNKSDTEAAVYRR